MKPRDPAPLVNPGQETMTQVGVTVRSLLGSHLEKKPLYAHTPHRSLVSQESCFQSLELRLQPGTPSPYHLLDVTKHGSSS